MFTPISTERLLLRPARVSDTRALFERRADPVVSELQDWPMPYSLERAEAQIERSVAHDTPSVEGGFMLTITDHADSIIYGDINIFLEDDGRTSGIGYSITPAYWGRGFASEALAGVIDWLFDIQGISRAYAMLHPDNHRSARVLETCGFVYEGHAKNACWIEDEVSDDLMYGMTPAQRVEWNERPRTRPSTIELVEPYPTGLRQVIELGTHRSQERMVTPIVISLAQVAVPPYEEGFEGNPGDPRVVPRPRVIHADGEPVGFVMLQEPTEANPEPHLWRLLIDRLHQRRGIGKKVLDVVIEQAKAWGSESITVTWNPGVGSPGPLYLSMGFEPTGEIEDGEIVARLVW